MKQSDIAIIGYGVVGRHMGELFPEARIVDPFYAGKRDGLPFDWEGENEYSVAFVCVPTDRLPDGSADISLVAEAIIRNHADIFVIKSAIPPGTAARVEAETGKWLVVSPEFVGATPHSKGADEGFVILGGDRLATDMVAELYKERKSGDFRIVKTDALTAELVKYAENAFYATKVTFFAEFYRYAEALGVDIDEFRELLLLDGRIGRSHTFTYRAHPYYASHCLDKDLPAIVVAARKAGSPMPLLEEVVEQNQIQRGKAEGQG